MPRPIPRRTSNIELWDNVPVGNRTAWQREMLQFWSLMLAQGRRLRTPPYMVVLNPETGRNRPRTTREMADLLGKRIRELADHISPEIAAAVEEWLAEGLIVPGERVKGLAGFPAAGLSVPHYIGLALFARGSTRERYWATTFYLWLASDQHHTDITGKSGVTSRLASFLSDGLRIDPSTDTAVPQAYAWRIDHSVLERKDPEVLLAARALESNLSDGLPSFAHGLPKEYLLAARPVLDERRDRFTVLCPGSVMLLRRNLDLLLGQADVVGHGALGQLMETALVQHAAQYYVRGMRVLNDLVRARRLPDDCATCWARFQEDLSPLPVGARVERWSSGDYRAAGTAEDARFVEATCASPYSLFLNAGTKEDNSAKDLGRISLENLRQQLAEYTVNRLWISIAWDVASEVAPQVPGCQRPASVAEVLPTLDAVYSTSAAVLLVADKWRSRLKTLITDRDVPTTVVDEVLDLVDQQGVTPRALEDLTRTVIAETILSTRYFGRYVEVLNSILGGGALPSNQDSKGMMARGGRSKLPFHLAINDSLLEFLVAVTSLEAEAAGKPLSFSEFLDQLSSRYLLDIDRAPSHLLAGSGLAAEAISQSREALRERLSAMGLLDEFSDSSTWNRIAWGRRP